MSTSEERGRLAKDHNLNHQQQVELVKTLKQKGYSNTAIAHIMRINVNSVRIILGPHTKIVKEKNMSTTSDIEWGYNCLTQGVHHGRPETIWNIPLMYAATVVFRKHILKSLVVARIYNDALQYVDHKSKFTGEWASRIRELAEEKFDNILQHKVGEISKYYESGGWEREQEDSARRVIEDKLNPGYEPLHPHDTINMLCRIIGVSCSIKASEELI